MGTRLIWDEAKRAANLAKHGLDFAEAAVVLESRYRLDVSVVRKGEARIQSFSYVMNRLAVLTVVHLAREGATRIISFRPASEVESEAYHDWLSKEDD
ncbi:BrnT family toxin [Thauera butanivorans]|uniref:BrnT family toxin n=1 Tax=Thauera butanivorans TaxID=86174 RepID=UPI0008381323|nr:BrnT family toxin [Thauera butanivorans]